MCREIWETWHGGDDRDVAAMSDTSCSAQVDADAELIANDQRSSSAASATSSVTAQTITIILTTSPSPVMPSTELLHTVLRSFVTYSPALCSCRLIIVCDGAKPAAKSNFRSGRIDDAARTSYVEYKQRLQELVRKPSFEFPRAELLELQQHHGFGFAVHAALQLVTTPLVCVVQHDRVLLRPVDLGAVCSHLLQQEEDTVGYVLLPIRATMNYPHRVRVRLGERGIRPPASDIEPLARAMSTTGGRLLPCLGWYDSTHICLTRYYTGFVFGGTSDRAAAFASPDRIVTKGAFLEAEFAPRQMDDVVQLGVDGCLARWRTYLYDDGVEEPVVGHLNGAQTVPMAVLQEQYGERSGIGQRWQRETASECSVTMMVERDGERVPSHNYGAAPETKHKVSADCSTGKGWVR